MQLPLQITFRDVDPSPAIEALIREKAEKLERFCEHLISCRVIVEPSHRRHAKGNLYHVRIDVTVPDRELVTSRDPQDAAAHVDPYIAVRDAFDAMYRQIEDYVRVRRREVKTHAVPPHGSVFKLFPDEGYGIIAASDGQEVYFHRNSIVEGEFDELAVGTEVRFVEVRGDEGPQASAVYVVGHHHVIEGP